MQHTGRYVRAAIITATVFYFSLLPEATPAYEYKAGNMRDPFVSLIMGEERTGLGLEAVETIDDIRLEGFLYDPKGDSLVILNGEILKEGDRAFNVKVVTIRKDEVAIKIYDRLHRISVVEEGGKIVER